MEVELTDGGRERAQLNGYYIWKWSIIFFIVYFLLSVFLSYFGGIFFIGFIALQFNIDLLQYFSFLSLFFPIIFMIIMILRNRIINHLINKANRDERLDSLYRWRISLFRIQIFIIIMVSILSIFYVNNIYSNIITDSIFLLIWSILLLNFPTYYIFADILIDDGYIFIEFSELNINIYNFEKRQYWLTKICQRVSDIFKKGNIRVNKDELRSEFNFQMRNGVNMKSKINEMKNWFLSEDRNDDLFSIFEKIWPNVKQEPYSKLIWHQRIDALLPQQYIKWLIALIIFIIVEIRYPELIIEIIRQLVDKLVS